MSKFFASIYDYVNACEISQLDAILVALFCLFCGCGLIVTIFIASIFQQPTKPLPRIVTCQSATGGCIRVPGPSSQSVANVQIFQSSFSSPQPYVVTQRQVPSSTYALPQAVSPSVQPVAGFCQPTLSPCYKSAASTLPVAGGYSNYFGRPRTSNEVQDWSRFGQVAAANRGGTR